VIGDLSFYLDQLEGDTVRLNETGIWLLIIMEARMVPTTLVENLIKENRELACILGASIRTAQAKVSRIGKSPITNRQ
jgi:hypothetical protein